MTAAGLRAFQQLGGDKARVYSYEQRKTASLSPAQERRFRSEKKAWAFLQDQPPSYRRMVIWWIVSAKKEETRERRLGVVMDASKAGRRLGAWTRPE